MSSIIKDDHFVNYGISVVEVEVVGSGVSGVVELVELVVDVGSGVVELVTVPPPPPPPGSRVVVIVGSIVVELVEVVGSRVVEVVEVVGSIVVEVEVVGSRVVEVVVVPQGSQGDDREQGSSQHSRRPVSGFVTG